MSGFTSCAAPRAVSPDPLKRVNYTHGLVLGADEFLQEFTYLSGRDEWLARELIGNGTVAGLRVTARHLAQAGPALVIDSGLALSPRGRPIRVPVAQAVHLDEWLEAHRGEFVPFLRSGVGSPPADVLPVAVVLCYGECRTDNVPGPGQPCRTDEPPSLYTRIADDFRLELRFERPPDSEEAGLRQFVAWLRDVELTDAAAGTLTLDGFLDALRTAATGSSTLTELASPPEPIRIPSAAACDYARAAFRVWTTELRSLDVQRYYGGWGPAPCDGDEDDCVLLADIEIPVAPQSDGRWMVDAGAPVVIDESRRPYLLHLRLLQELVLCRERGAHRSYAVAAAGIVRGDVSNTTHRRPLFNGLRVTSVADGELTVSFDGYAMPAVEGPFQFVVKAMSETRAAPAGAPVIVNVDEFEPGGIRLRVADVQGNPIPALELAGLEIAIEISRCVASHAHGETS
jgi:hypothetical protein